MAISGDYANPVTINGFACKNCTEVDLAKKADISGASQTRSSSPPNWGIKLVSSPALPLPWMLF